MIREGFSSGSLAARGLERAWIFISFFPRLITSILYQGTDNGPGSG